MVYLEFRKFFQLIFLVNLFVSSLLGQQLGSQLLNPANKIVKQMGTYRFVEGPAADSLGNVYFSDITDNKIYLWKVTGEVSLFRSNTAAGNGLYFDKNSNLLVCHGTSQKITSISPSGIESVIADSIGGKPLNSPNDLWVEPANGVYFTDPRYSSGALPAVLGFHVYYISADRKSITRVISDLTKPNGIIGTPDGKTLYVADPGANKIFSYNIIGSGQLSGKKQFAPEGADGMTLDELGNVYLCNGNSISVYQPSGGLLGKIPFPENPVNATFGGANGNTLFVAANTGIYTLQMEVKGSLPISNPSSIRFQIEKRKLFSQIKNQVFFNGHRIQIFGDGKVMDGKVIERKLIDGIGRYSN